MPWPEVSLKLEPKEPDKADPLPDAAEPEPNCESSYEWSGNSRAALLPLSSASLSWRQKADPTHPQKLHLSMQKETHAVTEFVTRWPSSHINSTGLEFLALKMSGGLELRITFFMGENQHLNSTGFCCGSFPNLSGYCMVAQLTISADKRGVSSLHILLDGMKQPYTSEGALQGKWDSSPDSLCEATASAAPGTPAPLSGPYPAVSADPAFPAQSGFRRQHFFPCLQSSDSCLWVYRGSWRGLFYAHVWKPTHTDPCSSFISCIPGRQRE